MRWIDNADSWVCSKCRFESLYLKPYCPRCNDVAENVEMPSKRIENVVERMSELYELVVTYMALTELYDRSLTNMRSPYDSTEAYVENPRLRKISNEYAIRLREEMNLKYFWDDFKRIIHQNRDKNAQWWIDEYNRLISKNK